MTSINKIIEYSSIEFMLIKSKINIDDPINAKDNNGYSVIFTKKLSTLNLSDNLTF